MTIDTTEFKHLYPYESNFHTINGHKYHYIDEGDGDPVIMVHGNPTWSFYYRSLIDALKGNNRAIAVDHIGCGLSDKPNVTDYDYRLKSRVDDLENLIDSLNLKKKITLIVHDWGGMIGLAYAVRHPEKIGRIVLTNTSGFLPPGKGIPVRLWIMRYLTPFAKFATLGLNLFSRAAIYMAPVKKLSKDVRKGLTAPYNNWNNRMATYKFVQDIPLKKGDFSFDLVESVDKNLDKLKDIPMMFCWGEHDFIFTMEYFFEWQRRFPDAKKHVFPTAGHYILEDEPEKVSNLIKEFINDNPL